MIRVKSQASDIREWHTNSLRIQEAIFESSRWFERIVTRKQDYMLLVKAAFDESGKLGDHKWVVFAGCVTDAAHWEALSKEWRGVLEENNIHYLSMKEAIHYKGEFREWREREQERNRLLLHLANIAHRAIICHITVPMSVEDFLGKSAKEKARVKHLQYAGFEGCVLETVRQAQKKDPNALVHIWCDSSEEFAVECMKLYFKLKFRNSNLTRSCIAITFADDEHFPPLQVADMIAYAARQEKESFPVPVCKQIYETLHQKGYEEGALNYGTDKSLGEGFVEPLIIVKKD